MPSLEDRVRDLQSYVHRIPDPDMSNYRQVLASWKKTMQELLGILMEIVRGENVPPAS